MPPFSHHTCSRSMRFFFFAQSLLPPAQPHFPHHPTAVSLLDPFLYLNFFLIGFLETGREMAVWERNLDQLPPILTPAGNLTRSLLVHQPSGGWGSSQLNYLARAASFPFLKNLGWQFVFKLDVDVAEFKDTTLLLIVSFKKILLSFWFSNILAFCCFFPYYFFLVIPLFTFLVVTLQFTFCILSQPMFK